MSNAINELSIEAKTQLLNGSDISFNQLVSALNTDRKKTVAGYKRSIPSLDAHDIDSEYMELLFNEVKTYDGSHDFVPYFKRALHFRILNMARKVVPKARRTQSFEKSVEEDGNFSIVPLSPSAEDTYLQGRAESDILEEIMAERNIGPYERAVIRHRAEHGTSLEEVVNIAPQMFRNKQQAWRQTVAKVRPIR